MRWDLFDSAVQAARHVAHDEDIARDAALAALTELGAEADESRVRRRARDRAKDALRRRQPDVHSVDMDTLPSEDNVFEEVAELEEEAQLCMKVGTLNYLLLYLKKNGWSDREIAERYQVSETTAARWRAAAELARDKAR